MCPACLFETPHDLTICQNGLQTVARVVERVVDQSSDRHQSVSISCDLDTCAPHGQHAQDEDVDEVDELIRKAKATARQQQAEHAGHEEHKYPDRTIWTLTGDDQNFDRPRAPPPEPLSGVHTHEERESPGNERMRRQEGNKRAQKQREETERKANPLPIWAIRLVPGCIIECTTEAVNVDAVDGAARVIDVVIMMHNEKQKQRPDNNRLSMLAMRSTSIQIARYGH